MQLPLQKVSLLFPAQNGRGLVRRMQKWHVARKFGRAGVGMIQSGTHPGEVPVNGPNPYYCGGKGEGGRETEPRKASDMEMLLFWSVCPMAVSSCTLARL